MTIGKKHHNFKIAIKKKSKHCKRTDEAYKPLGTKYSDEHITKVINDFKRQTTNLQNFMNAYYDTLLSNNTISEELYNRLYDILGEIDTTF